MINSLVDELNIPNHLILQYKAVPIELSDNILYVAMSLPYNIMAIDDFSAITGLRIEPVAFEPDKITKLLQENETKSNLERDCFGSVNRTDTHAKDTTENGSDRNSVTSSEPTEIISFSESGSYILTIDQPKLSVLNDISNSSAAEILEYILYIAATNQASDVHIEPQENHVRVRQRLDRKSVV